MTDIPNKPPNGATVLLNTFLANGVDTCFGNPGTSETSFVVALDGVRGFRSVLALQENVATGAADGFYRMADRPAATLLHLGSGLSNGSANLHNARKAGSGIVNVIGEHSTQHLQLDSPLKSDLSGLARPVSDWSARVDSAGKVSRMAAEAIAVARGRPAGIASLMLCGDASWSAVADEDVGPALAPPPTDPDRADIGDAVAALRADGDATLLLLSRRALRSGALRAAGRVAAATGCTVMAARGIARMARGAGEYTVPLLPYDVDPAAAALVRFGTLICVGAGEPIGFFGYPSKPSRLRASGSRVIDLCSAGQDPEESLAELGAAFPRVEPTLQALDLPGAVGGPITSANIAAVLARTLPEGAIVVDELITTGRHFFPTTAGARPHDWLQNAGGAIGFGTPAAIGAAVACPDRPVVCLVGDGSFMMTPQSLWTMAREGLHATVVVFANRSYRILEGEVRNVGYTDPIGPVAAGMLSIDRPALDFAAVARGLGVPSASVADAVDLDAALRKGIAESGPSLITVDCP